MTEPRYSSEHPCRCGFDGAGVHRCHAGRNPDYPGGHCPNPAEPGRFVSAPLGTWSLAGVQMKITGSFYHYCTPCWAEVEAAGLIRPQVT